MNPALGNESLATVVPAPTRRHVVVVGGGPAGCEAARTAAMRGHRVTLLERARRLGGTAWFSQLTTPPNGALVTWYEHELASLEVEVRLGVDADVSLVAALAPDTVVVATGARRGRPDVPGADLPHVRTGDDLKASLTGDGAARGAGLVERIAVTAGRSLGLLSTPDRIRTWSKRWMPLGAEVVVIGGSLVGLELAEFLAERGRKVTVLEEAQQIGMPMAMPRRWRTVGKATAHGVALVRGATVVEITADSVHYVVGDERRSTPARDVVVASSVTPDGSLADTFRAAGLDVHLVGDAVEVGYIEGAVHSGAAAGRAV